MSDITFQPAGRQSGWSLTTAASIFTATWSNVGWGGVGNGPARKVSVTSSTLLASDVSDTLIVPSYPVIQYGHVAGDMVLKEFAARLKQSLRISNLPVRLGGDAARLPFRRLERSLSIRRVAAGARRNWHRS